MTLMKLQLEEYMLPCLWKKTFNIECLGCGTQRALALMLKGEFHEALLMYPAIYTLVIMMVVLVLHLKFKFTHGHRILLALFILNISIIVINYILKIT